MMKLKHFFTLFFLLSFLLGGTDGTIRGKVTDEEGVPLPGANVILPELSIGAATDIDGNYLILNIPVGEYDVVVTMMGYAKFTKKEIQVMMDQTVWLNFKLPLEVVAGDEVEVIGERPLVERGTTAKKITVSKEAIQALPIRDLTELYTLQSGVVKVESRNKSIPNHEERGIEEIHVKGGRSGQIAYMMDGMYLRNPIFGSIGSGTRLNLFAIKEFDWQPGGFNAEYGDAQSAVSNFHTNSGGKLITYKIKYETSQVGALINSAMGKTDETENFDLIRGYNDLNIGIGGPILGIPKLSFWISGQYTTKDNYSVYEFDDRVFTLHNGDYFYRTDADLTANLENISKNKKALAYPWDNV
ncbi:MAG TPA: hypothetical protein EYO16_02995, partial [Candidatus Marinimicrobia bacterium]|nr:hypothetical protein [Candidatus Neomarinimicrobiota bacterium]